MNQSVRNAAQSWEIHDAQYAKGKKVVRIHPDKPTGYKMSGAYLAEAVGGKWVHRSHGFAMSDNQANLFAWLMSHDWDAKVMMFRRSKPCFQHPTLKKEDGGAAEYTLKEVKQLMKESEL